MRVPAQRWSYAAVAAVTAVAACASAAFAQAPAAPRLNAVRCPGHSCRMVKPRASVVLAGRNFQPGTLVVFSIRRGSYVMNVTRAARFLNGTRLRARVPSDAVSGPVYLLGTTSRSNSVWLNVRGNGTCPSNTGPGDAVTRWRPVIVCVLGLLHQPQTPALVNDVLLIIRYESGGDPTSTNNWDSNAQAGDPSRGLMQVIGATFATYHDPLLLYNIFDPAANIYAGLAYGIARYGSIQNIPGVRSIAAGGSYQPYDFVAR